MIDFYWEIGPLPAWRWETFSEVCRDGVWRTTYITVHRLHVLVSRRVMRTA